MRRALETQIARTRLTRDSAGLTQERQAGFEAGRPLAVGLLLGEITGGSIGTIFYVDGDRIYGFGHPMFGIGPVALPIIEAKVLGEISNLDAPCKFATLNPTVRGILTEDRLPAVRGVLDQEPGLVPITSRYRPPFDLNRDGTVNLADFVLFADAFGQESR